MQEDLGLLLVERSEDWHHLLKSLFVVIMLLHCCSSLQIETLDCVLEILALSIYSCKKMLVDILLVVELSDFLLRVKVDTFIMVPVLTVELSEQIVLLLTSFRFWKFNSLCKQEWKSKELFPVRGFVDFAWIKAVY
jgi:hypothetical protein